MYEPDKEALAYLLRAFTHHPPHGDQVERYQALREQGQLLARQVLLCCPPSRERSVALTNIEQAVMWANAAIARNEDRPPPRPES